MRLFKKEPKKVQLPIGMADFDAWAKEIIGMTKLPDNDSMRFALAGAIWGLKSHEGHVPLEYFANVLIKAASSQVAGQVIEDLKAKQKAAQEEAAKAEAAKAEAQPVEATTPTSEVANVNPQT